MRIADENKKQAISEAAIELIVTCGFSETSLSKIAKKAGVATASIYTYFENKDALLTSVYLMVKKNLAAELNRNFHKELPVKDGMHVLFDGMIRFFEKNPLHFVFMEQFKNCPLSNRCKEEAHASYEEILRFIQHGMDKNILKNVSFEILFAYLNEPLSRMLKLKKSQGAQLTAIEREQLFEMSWDAIKK